MSAFHSIKSRNISNRENFVFTMCHIKAGTADNVFPDEAFMSGTIRTYDTETQEKIFSRIRSICDSIADAMECGIDVQLDVDYPPTINHVTQAQHVERIA